MKILGNIKNRELFILYFQKNGTKSSMGVESHQKVEINQNPCIWKFTKALIFFENIKTRKLFYLYFRKIEKQH